MYLDKSLKVVDFQKNAREILKDMKNDREFTDVTLVSEDGIMFLAHKVIMASSSTFFQSFFRSNNQANPLVCMRGVSGKFLASLIDVLYTGETKIEETECKDFIMMLRNCKVYEQENTDKDNIEIQDHDNEFKLIEENKDHSDKNCWFYNSGYCKKGAECKYSHKSQECASHFERGRCEEQSCKDRHRREWDTLSLIQMEGVRN